MAGMNYATSDDVISLWRSLTATELQQVEQAIPIVCAELRNKAHSMGYDLDAMVRDSEDLALIAKSVTVDVVKRYICNNDDSPAMTQYTQSALGYSQSGTYLVAGGGVFIKRSELARLGLNKQRYGVISFC